MVILTDRFWAKVKKSSASPADRPELDGCWLWTASGTPDGYGHCWHEKKLWRAHRLSYEALIGPIPYGMEVDHICRVRNCVNPKHLEAVTHHENLMRGQTLAAIQAKLTHCPRGHGYAGSNLYIEPSGRRRCRICTNEKQRRYKAKKMAVA